MDPQEFDRFFAVFIPFTKNLANPGKKVDFRDQNSLLPKIGAEKLNVWLPNGCVEAIHDVL